MHFGKNLKLANLVEYKDSSLQFVKYSILGKENKPIFKEKEYPVLKDITFPVGQDLQKLYDKIHELNLEKFYIISTINYDIKINPYFLYTNKMILRKMENSRLIFGKEVPKEKQKVK